MSPKEFADTIAKALSKKQVFKCKMNVVKSADPNRKLGPFADGQTCEFAFQPHIGETLQFLGAKFLVLNVTHTYQIGGENRPEAFLMLDVEERTSLTEEERQAEAKKVVRAVLFRDIELPPELEELLK